MKLFSNGNCGTSKHQKKIFCEKKTKKEIRCHVFKIDDATNRSYINVLSLSMKFAHTARHSSVTSVLYSHSTHCIQYPHCGSFFSNHMKLRSHTHTSESSFSHPTQQQTLVNERAHECVKFSSFESFLSISSLSSHAWELKQSEDSASCLNASNRINNITVANWLL